MGDSWPWPRSRPPRRARRSWLESCAYPLRTSYSSSSRESSSVGRRGSSIGVIASATSQPPPRRTRDPGRAQGGQRSHRHPGAGPARRDNLHRSEHTSGSFAVPPHPGGQSVATGETMIWRLALVVLVLAACSPPPSPSPSPSLIPVTPRPSPVVSPSASPVGDICLQGGVTLCVLNPDV